MSPKIVSTVAKHDGKLVALCRDGRIYEQARGDDQRPDAALAWRAVALDGMLGRVASISPKPNGVLIAVTTEGALYQQVREETRDYTEFKFRWEPVPLAGLQ